MNCAKFLPCDPPKGPAISMPDPDTRPVIARIIAAHLGAGPGQAELVPRLQKGLTRAIRRAALPFALLAPEVAEVSVQGDVTLGDGVAALPEHGLLAAIEDDEGRRGLIALDHPLVDALIEVQATGRVEDTDLPPRKITRIDEALCRDFVDLMLGAFAQETAEQVGRDWPDRMSYGSKVAERGQLNLLLPDRGYRLLGVSVTLGGRKTGDLVVLLPVDQAIVRRRAQAAPQSAAPVDWSAQMLSVLGAAPMTLDAVLMRVTMPLGEVKTLKEGDLVPFDRSDLSAVTLENDSGHVFARGGLGQLSGRRAVRFGGGGAATKAPASSPAAAPTSVPAMSAMPSPNMGQPGHPPLGVLDPNAPIGTSPLAELPMAAGTEMPMAGLNPDAPMGDLVASAPMGDFDPNAPMGGLDPNAPMG